MSGVVRIVLAAVLVPGLPAEALAQAGARSGPGLGEGAGTPCLAEVWQSGWFPYGGVVLVTALVVAVLVLRRLERGGRAPSIRALKVETDRTIAESDDVAFFAACRAAVQARLAARWRCAPGSITLAEMQQRGVGAGLQTFFEVADAVAYSGRRVSQEEMRRWQERVIAEIAAMERDG